MNLRKYSDAIVIAAFLLAASAASAEQLSQPAPLSNSQWEDIRQQVVLLDKIAYLPSLLPVVMTNRDALELSDAQVAAFRQWRKLHYREMVDLMNEIIQRRITLSKTTLDDQVSQNDMLAQQKEIFSLQEDLLRLRLSCRELIVSTFSPTQWDNLAFILEEYPRYAGLLDD
jgi:hypothetical protein